MTRERSWLRAACGTALLAGVLTACGDPCDGPPPPEVYPPQHALRNPDSEAMRQLPPDSFDVVFETSQGDVTVRIYREWAPMGVFRFYNLASNGFYDGSRFYRVLPGFVAQFGMSGHPEVDQVWHDRPIPDDPRRVSNLTGTLTYAKAGPDSRTTQLFFNFGQNVVLDDEGFAPIGRVIDGMGALFLLHGGYGDTPPRGQGPGFECMLSHGNTYLDRKYSRLDIIRRIRILRPNAARLPETDARPAPYGSEDSSITTNSLVAASNMVSAPESPALDQ